MSRKITFYYGEKRAFYYLQGTIKKILNNITRIIDTKIKIIIIYVENTLIKLLFNPIYKNRM